jgi:hypothetical protein
LLETTVASIIMTIATTAIFVFVCVVIVVDEPKG